MKKNGEKISLKSVKARIQNTGRISNLYGTSKLETVAAQGAGLINILNAIQSQTTVFPSEIALKDTARMKNVRKFNVTNRGNTAKTYYFSHTSATSFSPYKKGDDSIQNLKDSSFGEFAAQIIFSTQSIVVKPGATVEMSALFKAPLPASNFTIFSGFLVISNDKERIQVPYAGVIGNYQETPILARKSKIYDAWTKERLGVSLTTGVYNNFGISLDRAPSLKINSTDINTWGVIFPIIAATTKFASINLTSYVKLKNQFVKVGSYTPWVYSEFLEGPYIGPRSKASAAGDMAPELFLWKGEVLDESSEEASILKKGIVMFNLGYYSIEIYGLKNFGNMEWGNKTDANFDSYKSKVFSLEYVK